LVSNGSPVSWAGAHLGAAKGDNGKAAFHDVRACARPYLAEREGVSVQLLRQQESLGEHRLVVVGVLDDGRRVGVAKHRPHVSFERLHHRGNQLLLPVTARHAPSGHGEVSVCVRTFRSNYAFFRTTYVHGCHDSSGGAGRLTRA